MNQLVSILVLGLFTLSALPQQKPGESPQLPIGSILRVTLAEPLAAMDSKVGNPVRFQVMGLVTKSGMKPPAQLLTLVGHITEVQVVAKGQPECRLGIAFDKLQIEGPEQGRELKISALVDEVWKVSFPVASVVQPSVVPTSGDDPVQRASPPVGPTYLPLPRSQPGPLPVQGVANESRIKDFVLHTDESTNITIISCKKRNILLTAGAVMYVRLTTQIQ